MRGRGRATRLRATGQRESSSRHRSGSIEDLLGIDVGGTKVAIAFGAADDPSRPGALTRESFPTPDSGDWRRDLDHIAAHARQLADARGIEWSRLSACGVALPGPLDLEAGVLLDPPNLRGWHGAPVRDALGERLDVPVGIENDANAAVLAEWRFGAGRGAEDVVYLTMSTGVGGGILLGGRLHRGIQSSAGEIGHLPIEWEGEPCVCGMRGCLETYIGGAAWARRLAQRTPAESLVGRLAGDGAPTPEHVVAAAREGDAFALAEFERFNRYLAWAIVQIGFAFAPEVVVLGTIPSAAGDALCLDPVRERVRGRLWRAVREGMRIEASGCGERLGDLAGLSVALAAVSGATPVSTRSGTPAGVA